MGDWQLGPSEQPWAGPLTLEGSVSEPFWVTALMTSLLPQGCAIAKQLGAEIYLEGSAFTSEKSIHSIFRTASTVCLNKASPVPPKSPVRSLSKRLLHLPSRSELISSTFKKEKAKSCSIM